MPLPLYFAVTGALGYAVYRNRNKNKVNDKRQMERDAWRKWGRELRDRGFRFNVAGENSHQDSTSYRTSGASKTPRDSQSSLEVTNANDEMVISISEISNPMQRRWTAVHASTENPISRLNPLLSAVPLAAISGNVATTKYMAVQVAGDLTKAADGVGFRAWTVNGAGIREHARLFSPGQLNGFIGGAAIWQIASIAVAQKHLADINRKLDDIRREIERIHEFQQNDRLSRVLGCRRYFESVSEDIEHNTDGLETVIEDQIIGIFKVEEHLKLDLKTLVDKLKKAELGEAFNEQLDNFVRLGEQLFLCIETRMIGYSLMAIVSKGEKAVDNDLARALRDVEELETLIVCASDRIDDKLSEEASFWGNVGKFEETLATLEKLQPRKEFESWFKRVYEEIEMAQNIVEQRKIPQEILLKVNGQEIEGYAVSEISNI